MAYDAMLRLRYSWVWKLVYKVLTIVLVLMVQIYGFRPYCLIYVGLAFDSRQWFLCLAIRFDFEMVLLVSEMV